MKILNPGMHFISTTSFSKKQRDPITKKSYFKKDINPDIIIVRSLVTFRDIRETIESGPLCIISE